MRTWTRTAAPAAVAAGLLLTACSSTAGDDGTAPGGSDGASATDDAATADVELVSAGVLTMCTNPPYEPFEYEEDGEIVGLDVDIVREVATDLGVELEVVVTPFEGIQSGEDLNSRNCDVVASGITITEARAKNMDFSEPYFDADQGLLVPAGSEVETVEDLQGLTIGVQQATTGAAFAEEEGLTPVEFEDLGLQVEALRGGTVDAIINDIAVLGPFASDDFDVANTFPTDEQYGLGIRQGNTALLEQVNTTLERIRGDGTYDEIYERHIGIAPSDD